MATPQKSQPILVQDLALVNHVSSTLNISPQNATKLLAVLPNLKQMLPTLETEQGADLKRQLHEVSQIVQDYHNNIRQAREREAMFAMARNPTQPVQMQLPAPVPIVNTIHDPEDVTKSQSTNSAAHTDPGPAQWPPLRPTLNGGLPSGLQDGTPSSIQPPADDPSLFVPDIRPTSLRKNQGAEQHVRRKIQELVATIDPNVKVDADAEDLLLEIADEFIDSVANFASRLAMHRNTTELELRDLQLHLEMHHGIRIPGFSADPPSQLHNSASQPTGAGVGIGIGGAGGAAKKGGAPASVGNNASIKRTSRLAAVSQAKKDSRLL